MTALGSVPPRAERLSGRAVSALAGPVRARGCQRFQPSSAAFPAAPAGFAVRLEQLKKCSQTIVTSLGKNLFLFPKSQAAPRSFIPRLAAARGPGELLTQHLGLRV